MNDHREQPRCTASLCLTAVQSRAGEGAFVYSCLMVLVPTPCPSYSYGLRAGALLSLLPGLGFSHGLLVAAWVRGVLPRR